MARKIVITSGKGGVGKTTVTANLGLELARKSLRVALLDLDMGLNNLDVALHLDNRVVFDMIDAVEGKCRVRQALIQHPDEQLLYVMPSCHHAKRVITVDAVKKLVERMEESFDYILIDCPAGIETGFRRAVQCADEAIVVCTPHLSSVRDADKVLQCLNSYNMQWVGVVVNRIRGDLVASGDMLDAYEVFSLLNKPALGVLPEDDRINCTSTAVGSNNKPYAILADNLHYGHQNMYDYLSKYRGFFGRIRKNIRRNV